MKSIPIALQSDYDQDSTTLCLITRILTKSGDLVCYTNLDVDIEYDPAAVDPHGTGDDWGSAVHSSLSGFNPSRTQASADLSVDNAEISGLIIPGGVSLAQIRAGYFQGAKIRVYRINYMDTSRGHELVDYGRLGETRPSDSMWVTEFRSLSQLLKQPISPGYSITCRARFGSKEIGTDDGSFEELFPCGMSFTWVTGTITSVGSNPRRIFSDSALTQADDYFSPGVVEILDGPNAGAQMEVDDFTADAFTLALQLPYTLTVGTAYRVRQDCSKVHDDADHGCLYHWGAEWINHFQGEPDIPVSDGGANMIPGAQITRS